MRASRLHIHNHPPPALPSVGRPAGQICYRVVAGPEGPAYGDLQTPTVVGGSFRARHHYDPLREGAQTWSKRIRILQDLASSEGVMGSHHISSPQGVIDYHLEVSPVSNPSEKTEVGSAITNSMP